MQLNFKTEQFEGPLDLLLALIAKHKMNILDIEIIQLSISIWKSSVQHRHRTWI